MGAVGRRERVGRNIYSLQLPVGYGRTVPASRRRGTLTETDRELVERAREATEATFDPSYFEGAHMVSAAVRTRDGEVFTGVSQPAGVGRASVCAEPSALSAARIAGADGFATSVAVGHPLPNEVEDRDLEVVSACGVCRELLCGYDESCAVVFPTTEGPRKAPVKSLLPTRHW